MKDIRACVSFETDALKDKRAKLEEAPALVCWYLSYDKKKTIEKKKKNLFELSRKTFLLWLLTLPKRLNKEGHSLPTQCFRAYNTPRLDN